MNATLEAGIARVCCVCHPGDAIFQVRPEWRAAGVQVSHAYCTHHFAEALAEADTLTGPADDPSRPRVIAHARHGSSPSPARSSLQPLAA
jgi:hypothetical protein